MDMSNIYTKIMGLPTTIKSFIVANADDTFTIVLNSRMDNDTLLDAYKHELEHIKNNDYSKQCNIDIIEANAHRVNPNKIS